MIKKKCGNINRNSTQFFDMPNILVSVSYGVVFCLSMVLHISYYCFVTFIINRYIFEGLGHLISYLLINSAQQIKRINDNGIKKM